MLYTPGQLGQYSYYCAYTEQELKAHGAEEAEEPVWSDDNICMYGMHGQVKAKLPQVNAVYCSYDKLKLFEYA